MLNCFHNAEYKGPLRAEGFGKYVPHGLILDGLYIYPSREVH
jgi:hypothetical protein